MMARKTAMKSYVISLSKHDKSADYSNFERLVRQRIIWFGAGNDTYLVLSDANLETLLEGFKQAVYPQDSLFVAEVLQWAGHPSRPDAKSPAQPTT
jgi:hypothetical protein